MEAGLIANLGAFFGVKIVLLCLSGDLDQGNFLDEKSEEVFFSSSSQLLLVEQEEVFAAIGRVSEHGVTLVVCSRVNFTSQDVGGEIFGPDIIWLVSEESVNMEELSKLMLNLDSNLLVQSVLCPVCGSQTVVLHETYSIRTLNSNVVKRNYFGQWESKNGLLIDQPNVWERRANMSGSTLVNSVLSWPPFFTIEDNEVSGLMQDVMEQLNEVFQFR